MWTRFMDLHSGGGIKEEPYEMIYIEASEDEAVKIFYNRFGHNPNRVTCSCCGEDYSISQDEKLEQITGYDRGCEYDSQNKSYIERKTSRFSTSEYCTLEDYKNKKDVLIINASEIKSHERNGEVPEQGYVWR